MQYCVCELDDNKRFVYSQAYLQANWLKFQVFRPVDKSRNEVQIGTHLRNLGFSDMSQLRDSVKLVSALERSFDLWKVEPIRFRHKRAHLSPSLESLVSVSESQIEYEPSEGWGSSEEDA